MGIASIGSGKIEWCIKRINNIQYFKKDNNKRNLVLNQHKVIN